MTNNVKRWAMPFAVLAVAIATSAAIKAAAPKDDAKKIKDPRPLIEVNAIAAENHQVNIVAQGEVIPFESTQLSAQVSGEVVQWHPNFVAGGLVKRGELLFTIDKATYQAALLSAEAELTRAQATLIEEQAKADVAADEARRNPNLKHSDLYLRKPQLMTAQAAVKAAEAGLKRAQRDLHNCEVRAPFDALVVNRDLGTGQFVSTGAKIAVLHNVEYAEINLPIAGFDGAFLPAQFNGSKAIISQVGLNGYQREGQIVRDLGIVDKATRMNSLVVRLADPYGLNSQQPAVKFGSFVNVTIPGQVLQDVYRLPQELVHNNQVWVVGDDRKLEARNVTVLREEGRYILINEGLHNGDRLVTVLPEYPQTGQEVRIAGETPSASTTESETALASQATSGKEQL